MRKQTKLWKTKDGRKIRICDMSNKHLDNTIILLKRQADTATSGAIISGYFMLSYLQGEIAIDCVESDLSRLEEYGIEPSEFCPLYDNLIKEKERRISLDLM